MALNAGSYLKKQKRIFAKNITSFMRLKFTLVLFVLPFLASAQVMTPELLWSLGRVSPVGLSEDGKELVYKVAIPDIDSNNFDTKAYKLELRSGEVAEINNPMDYAADPSISPDGDWKLTHKPVKTEKILGTDYYPNLPKSNAKIYDQLNIRHWDTWEKGFHNHVFVESLDGKKSIDIMEGQNYDTPTEPFGGTEDYTWSFDGNSVIYVCKKLEGTAYVNSTNTDLYAYSLETGETKNLTDGNLGYDTNPTYSSKGTLAWLSMERDGYESDKNNLKIMQNGVPVNLTADWDNTVFSYAWSDDAKTIYIVAPTLGTIQLYSIEVPTQSNSKPTVVQITDGQWDVTGIVGQAKNVLYVTRTDMNHATEIYAVSLKSGEMEQITHVNDAAYAKIALSTVEPRWIKTTDGKNMLTWVIYPPNFDPAKKYPTLLYTQGGPQAPLSQFYSFRWNFQLMAANGYIIVAPNRRGMPGFGREWNETISKDWGGMNMKDYLVAIDTLSKEPYVDTDHLGCVGASYGGYSAFFLEGISEGRFNTFISHDGPFDLRSMYGTTEELFFMNWDIGGPYWERSSKAVQKGYGLFNPINHVKDWETPILIIQGGKDYRIPVGQGIAAFTATQQLGIKSRFLYLPNENHWVLHPQNGLLWQHEFFRWLKETI